MCSSLGVTSASRSITWFTEKDLTMNGKSMLIVATMILVLAIVSGVATSAQDKVPDIVNENRAVWVWLRAAALEPV
jgi:hypothetical protein